MLSICIPIYETNVRNLVYSLYSLACKLEVPWEIIGLDDGSSLDTRLDNRELNKLRNVKIVEQGFNSGRAEIRNTLGSIARYPVLIFIDNDMQLVDEYFLSKYLEERNQAIVYGGTVYAQHPPDDPSFRLHWKYGKKKEEKRAADRIKNPWISFKTNNFLVQKAILAQYPFDATLKTYGYEDLEWIMRIKKIGIPLKHIDNPLRHLGLETSRVLISKLDQAMVNLSRYSKSGEYLPIRLFMVHRCLVKSGLAIALSVGGSFYLKRLRNSLIENHGGLWMLDLYKLLLFHKTITST